jgi:hypothetical protein
MKKEGHKEKNYWSTGGTDKSEQQKLYFRKLQIRNSFKSKRLHLSFPKKGS